MAIPEILMQVILIGKVKDRSGHAAREKSTSVVIFFGPKARLDEAGPALIATYPTVFANYPYKWQST